MKIKINTILNYIKAYFKVSTLVVITGLIYSLGGVIRLDAEAQSNIDAFVARATFEYEETKQTPYGIETRKYYSVSRETFELDDSRNVFYDEERNFIGNTGDIIVTRQSPFPYIPPIHAWISFFFGGHAAIVDENNRLYEATGLGGSGDYTILDVMLHPGDEPHDFGITTAYSSNYWLNPVRRSESDPSYPYYGHYNRSEFMVLRVKETTEEVREKAVDFARKTYEGERLYNYTFFLDLRYKFYCTDLMSRAYQDALIPENKQQNYSEALNDRFITSVNDLINAPETYITSYVRIENNTVHIYYLEDIEG